MGITTFTEDLLLRDLCRPFVVNKTMKLGTKGGIQ